MQFVPITASEARGDSAPMRLACLSRLATRGQDILSSAARRARPRKPLSASLRLEAWKATREPWGGLTIDLEAGQSVSRSTGYAVSTGRHAELPVDASYSELALTMEDVMARTPLGQHLGVFYDSDLNRIDIDSIYVTDDRDDAIAVGVASHSTGGAYDFATGDALWMPHLG